MGKIRANAAVVIVVNGLPRGVRAGEEFDRTDPVVKEYPWLFTDTTVEAATAAPGEKRAVGRPRKTRTAE